MLRALSLLFILGLTACGKMQSADSGQVVVSSSSSSPSTPAQSQPPVADKAEPLIWESAGHPERAQWSEAAYSVAEQNFSDLDKAQDVAFFCPNYRSLTRTQKINLWADVFAATAYFECGWNAAANSVDVGNAGNKDTWSVGLLQLSVVDQANYGLNFGFTFSDLQDPAKNLKLGVAIMAKQIHNHGLVMIPVGGSGLYWATLHPGGKYDASATISKMTMKLSFCGASL